MIKLLRIKLLYSFLLVSFILFPTVTYSQTAETGDKAEDRPEDLAQFMEEGMKEIDFYSLEELLSVEITSVSKKTEAIMDVASSIYVINNEDIRRSAAARIVDILNTVPGLNFYEYTYTNVEYSSRFLVNPYPQTILMLVDGIPVNSPITGGVPFNFFQLPPEQIQQIEVIKGPGGTIYGANANTGIINIYTKKPEQTQGLFVSLDSGSLYYASPFIRFGQKIADSTYYSVYGNYITTEGYPKTELFTEDTVTDPESSAVSENKFKSDETDGLQAYSGGCYFEWDITGKITSLTKATFSDSKSKVYTNYVADEANPFVITVEGKELIISERMDVNLSKQNNLFIIMNLRNEDYQWAQGGLLKSNVSIYNFEVQDNLKFGDINDLSIGANARIVKYDIDRDSEKVDTFFSKPNATENLTAGFIQDTVKITEYADFTLGCKAERWTLISNEFEYSPSARLAVKPDNKLTLWSAASRSITVPGYIQTRIEKRILQPLQSSPDLYVTVLPGEDVDPIEFRTYEGGIRTSLIPGVFLDISGYYSEFLGLIETSEATIDQDNPTFLESEITPGQINVPLYYMNMFDGYAAGGEAVAKLNPFKNIRVEIYYTYYKEYRKAIVEGAEYDNDELHSTPNHTASLKPYVDLPAIDLYISCRLRWESKRKIHGYDYANQIPDDDATLVDEPGSHPFKLDASVEKRFMEGSLSVILWGKNLLYDNYNEAYNRFVNIGYPHTIERYYGVKVAYEL